MMRFEILIAVGCVAIASSLPAAAQVNPGRSYADHARDMRENTRDQFAQDVSEFRRMSDQDLLKSAEEYRKMTEPHRLNALEIAERARTQPLPADAGPRIRQALEADLNAWREAFGVSRKEWDSAQTQWLVKAESLTGQQWALQRANWFAARDSWITKRVAAAQARRR